MSQIMRATFVSPSFHGISWKVSGSGIATMSDSSIALKPVIDDPSKPMPSSSAASISLGVTAKLFRCPSMSVNQRSRNSIPSSSMRFSTRLRDSGSLVARALLSTCATLPPFKTTKAPDAPAREEHSEQRRDREPRRSAQREHEHRDQLEEREAEEVVGDHGAAAALEPADQPPERDVPEDHPDEPEDPEPDHRVEVADGGQADVAQEMRLLQPVESLAGHAHEELDANQQENDRRRPRKPRAAERLGAELAHGLGPLGAGLSPAA